VAIAIATALLSACSAMDAGVADGGIARVCRGHSRGTFHRASVISHSYHDMSRWWPMFDAAWRQLTAPGAPA
jgi:hypothetical protein